MAFRVEASAQAESDANSILEWLLSEHAGETGIRWFLALDDAIASLASFPERCPLAPETGRFPFEVRQLF
jgi:plasmid stabilization system protein ParE